MKNPLTESRKNSGMGKQGNAGQKQEEDIPEMNSWLIFLAVPCG